MYQVTSKGLTLKLRLKKVYWNKLPASITACIISHQLFRFQLKKKKCSLHHRHTQTTYTLQEPHQRRFADKALCYTSHNNGLFCLMQWHTCWYLQYKTAQGHQQWGVWSHPVCYQQQRVSLNIHEAWMWLKRGPCGQTIIHPSPLMH